MGNLEKCEKLKQKVHEVEARRVPTYWYQESKEARNS